jgi:hypothetical protein
MIDVEIYMEDLIYDSNEDLEGQWNCIEEIETKLPAMPRVGEFICVGLHPENSYEVTEVVWLMIPSPSNLEFKRVEISARKVQE